MKFFADTADIADIRELMETGLLDGVTTNPSLVKKSGGDFIETVTEIARICPGPVSAEVVALDHAEMMREAEVLRRIADLKSKLQRTNPVEEATEYNRMFGELVALESHRRTLRERAIGASD